MSFSFSPGLIPRNNWDYTLGDLLSAIGAIFARNADKHEAFIRMFGKKPLFTSSGRSSLYAVLKALHLPIGSQVGVPLYCCSVVFDAIRRAGLQPKFIDISENTFTLSNEDLRRKKKSLRALVAVHLFGHPVEMDMLLDEVGDIPIIEDCAQSLFSEYKGRQTGFITGLSFFSFRSGKFLSIGEGSAIFCNDLSTEQEIVSTIDSYKTWTNTEMVVHCIATYAKSSLYKRPWYGTLGYSIGTRLDKRLNLTSKTGLELRKIAQSDLGLLAKRLGNFREKVEKQRQNAYFLIDAINANNLSKPTEVEGTKSSFFQFPLRFDSPLQRDTMWRALIARGIDSARYLDDVVEIARRDHGYKGDCPVAEKCSKTVLLIPHYYTLSDADLDHVAESVNRISVSL